MFSIHGLFLHDVVPFRTHSFGHIHCIARLCVSSMVSIFVEDCGSTKFESVQVSLRDRVWFGHLSYQSAIKISAKE